MTKVQTAARWVLSLLLVYGIYTETGPATTLFAFLAVATLEGSLRWPRR